MESDSPTLARLDEQREYYSRKAREYRRWFHAIKVIQVLASASVSVTALTGNPVPASVLGALIVILEGVEGLFKFHDRWTTCRTTSNLLQRERHLWLAQAGPYAGAALPAGLFAERVENILADEQMRWVEVERRTETPQAQPPLAAKKSC
jgi:hypothetical protein